MFLKICLCNAKIKNVKGKITDINNLATNTTIITEINKVKAVIPILTNLPTATATTTTTTTTTTTITALIAVVNKVLNINNFVKNTDYNRKNSEIKNKVRSDHDKYITSEEFKKSTSETFIGKLED